jgi:hypothetical protein
MHARPRTALAPSVCLVTALFASSAVSAQSTAQSTQPTATSATSAAPAQQAASPAAQAAPAPARAPIFNRANERLPSWLRVRGEFRERVEGFQSGGFTEGRDDYYSLSRVRLNVAVTATPWLSFQTNVHDARVAEKQIGPIAPPFRGPFDVRTAFADVGTAKSPVALRVGRQELAFGEQRLLGHLAWVNTGRVWDAARTTLRSKPMQVDGFANRLYGAYGSSTTLIPQATVEPYVFFRRDENLASELGPRGTLQQATFGARAVGKLPARLDYGIEMAAQRGSLADDSLSAWAGHWQIRESLPGKGAVKLISEYNFATGDADPRDGTRSTFDQLYPTGHDKLGLSDQVGWKNVHHLREGVEFSPWKNTPLSVSYHTWWLADRNDGLYAASGALVARVAGGAASSHVGQEIDVQITRALTPQLSVTGGYAYMTPGKFLKQATPGASYSAPFVMATYAFLAER